MPRFSHLIAAATTFTATTVMAASPGIAAVAQAFSSAYSSTADKDCRTLTTAKVAGDEYAAERVCRGPVGFVVLKQEDDLRETVSVGRSAKKAGLEPAAAQGFGPFNSTTDTVEWRIGGNGKAFAMIQRWHIADKDDPDENRRPRTKQLLVVTRLPPGAACHVAYVDVTANRNPNDLARKAAEDIARKFDCRKSKVTIAGRRGRAIDLAMPR